MTTIQDRAKRMTTLAYQDHDPYPGLSEDAGIVAKAYLAEHDETPVDEAWFESIGATWQHDENHHWPDWLGLGQLEWYQFANGGTVMAVGDREIELKTRGQVRTMFRALGINPTEE